MSGGPKDAVDVDFREIASGDAWELFARDFFAAIGLVVEVPPGRGADGGRDLLVSEQLRGSLASRKFTWLVSCKHHAHSGRAVGVDDEPSIADRLRQHRADGFLGFYSTMASSGLVERLRALAEPRPGEAALIQRFEVFDGARIAGRFHAAGLAHVVLQHLPTSYVRLRPIHILGDAYEPLPCDVCGRDVLMASLTEPSFANIVFARRGNESKPPRQIASVHVVCRGDCDRKLSKKLWDDYGLINGWYDGRDYCNPLLYLYHLAEFINETKIDSNKYTDEAHKKYLHIFLILSQRTIRHVTNEDKEHFGEPFDIKRMLL